MGRMDINKTDIVLITTSYSQLCLGMRCLSSYLKSKQLKVRLIFFPPDTMANDFSPDLLEQLRSLVSDTRLIGISVMTMDLLSSIKLTRYLKKIQPAPIICGGIHPTICPEESLEFADIVCVGEGEEILYELLQKTIHGEDITHIEGIYLKDPKGIVKNELRSLVPDLNQYPHPDYSGNEHWIMKDGRLVEMNGFFMKDFFKSNSFIVPQKNQTVYTYIALSSRGCPFKCNYCSNILFLDRFRGKGKMIRRKSIDYFINELKVILHQDSYINFINIYDDDFLSRGTEEIEEFSERYKREIKLPFHCLATPQSITEEKLTGVVNAGCKTLQLGIQSGSERVNREIYNRMVSNSKAIDAIQVINRYKDKLLPRYDFIVDNPYETKVDKFETLRFVYKIPKPFKLQVFSLVFYPHTVLFDKAKKDNLLTSDNVGTKKQMSKFNNLENVSYYTLILSLSPLLPKSLYRFLIAKYIYNLFEIDIFGGIFRCVLKILVKINRKMKLNVYKLVIRKIA